MKAKEILIIDDEVEIVSILKDYFTDEGWVVYTANNGHQGLKAILESKPNVIISDINMPDMDGLDLLEKVYQQGITTPVILLTGFRDVKKMQRAWQACVFDFMDKPIDFDVLSHITEGALQFGEDYVIAARKRFDKIRAAASGNS